MAEGGRGAAELEFQDDLHVYCLLKTDNSKSHEWETQIEKELNRYNINPEEFERLKELPRMYHGTPFVTGSNKECMMLYDGAIVSRCEALILKAKGGKANKKEMMAKMESVKELLAYAKTKRKAVRLAGGEPLPVPEQFSKPITFSK